MKRRHTIPTIIGIILVLLGIALTVFAVQFQTIFKTQAGADTTPQGVRITNVFDTSFNVSWVTGKPAAAAIEWGTSSILGQTKLEDGTDLKEIHSITVDDLQPNTVYYFKIRSGGELIDNSGIPWQVQTGATLAPNTTNHVISGSILTVDGQPAGNAIVYLTAGNTAPLSVKTSTNGSWLLPLGQARTSNNADYAQLQNDTLLSIFVQGGNGGIATAQASITTANTTPPITLGQSYDFRNNEITVGDDTTPRGSLDLPQNQVDSPTGFTDDTSDIATGSSAPVTLESIKKDGELIATTQPEFFGEAPAGETLTITVESDPITETITVPQSGDWKWQPPTDLPPGEHKVTIKWRDDQGILRALVRSFVVYASDDPSFVSTPSGTQATPKPLATPTLAPVSTPITATPKASASASPSSSPRVAIPATSSGTVNAGSLTPTLALSIMGVVLLGLSIFVIKRF